MRLFVYSVRTPNVQWTFGVRTERPRARLTKCPLAYQQKADIRKSGIKLKDRGRRTEDQSKIDTLDTHENHDLRL
jgi:hypothetical protein